MVANEGFFSGVQSAVLFQILFSAKSFLANGALVCLGVLVDNMDPVDM
jgi:hypothetical protein